MKKKETDCGTESVTYDIFGGECHFVEESAAAYDTVPEEYTVEDYYALPAERRVELIDGTFYDMASPSVTHQKISMEVSMMFHDFIKRKKGGCQVLAAPMDVQLDCDDKTMVQPDMLVVCDSEKLQQDRCVFGAPDFVLEILSESTRKKDVYIKTVKYMNAGVREYWMVDVKREKVITYFWEEGRNPVVYGLENEIPVKIFDGELKIRLQDAL